MSNPQSDIALLEIIRLKTSDVDELCEVMRGWNQEYIQLQRGRCEWEITFIQIGEFQIFDEYLEGNVLNRGNISSENFAVSIPQGVFEYSFNLGQKIVPHSLLIGQKYELKTSKYYRHIVLLAPIEDVLKHAELMQIPLPRKRLTSSGILIPNIESLKSLNNCLREVILFAKTRPELLNSQPDNLSDTSISSLIITDILSLLVNLFTERSLTFLPEKNCKRRRLVKEAEALMRKNLENPMTLTQLCRSIGQSQRTLNYAFQEAYGLPPMTYLKHLRLHDVRQALRNAEPQTTRVQDVATRFGFWHMGQFSSDYKQMFGELPSIALKRKNF